MGGGDALRAVTVSRDVGAFDLLVEDPEAIAGSDLGDLTWDEAPRFVDRPEAAELEVVMPALDSKDECRMPEIAGTLRAAEARGLHVPAAAQNALRLLRAMRAEDLPGERLRLAVSGAPGRPDLSGRPGEEARRLAGLHDPRDGAFKRKWRPISKPRLDPAQRHRVGGGSGKTTTLNALSSFIDDAERILTIEDTAEMQLHQTHVGRMESRPADVEGHGAMSQRDRLKNVRRIRPDRIIVGEPRGEEVLDMLQVRKPGDDGSMTTIHDNTARGAVSRLENMIAMAGIEMPLKAVRAQIASAVHLILQATRLQDGLRRIVSTLEVTGMEGA